MSRSDWLNIGAGAVFAGIGLLFVSLSWGLLLIFIGFVFALCWFFMGEDNQETLTLDIPPPSNNDHQSEDLSPNLVFTTFSVDLIAHLRNNAFLVHLRNDAVSPLATAKNVLAHIGYRRQNGHGMQVDYAAFMENARVINIERGHTKRLIVALTEDHKNFAVNFTGPRTNVEGPQLVSVGELSPGQWMMVVKVNAENYQKTGYFELTVEQTGAIGCRQIKNLLW
jgi:hypothetical protein